MTTNNFSYSMMGASGCGKTTLISCLVGINQLDSGTIEVFGEDVYRLKKSRIGYMPQDPALIFNFNIREIIWFFGTIVGMDSKRINERFEFLKKLLELPEDKKLIRDCSGGQQRRISLALTLLHEPELLILDEPTVGVDPLLRCKIWDYLMELTTSNRVTVLLSTHYIEEARQSTCVGVMRNGVLIAEDSPINILQKCDANSLEAAFLRLSISQDSTKNRSQSIGDSKYDDRQAVHKNLDCLPKKPMKVPTNQKIVLALLRKNFIQIIRNIE